MTVETVQVARDSLVEDRVIEITGAMVEDVPDEYRPLITATTRSCARRWPPRAAGWA